MRPSEVHELVESAVSSGKAAVSVLLVLLYGFLLRRSEWISQAGESNVSKLGTTFLLPALLFSEIGPLATFENLKSYWPIIPFTLLFQFISLAAGLASSKAGMPRHYVPAFVFNNVTSLPLLLVTALASTGSLDILILPGSTLDQTLKKGRVYILINALVGNLTRFALGPYLMKTHKEVFFLHVHTEDPLFEPTSSSIGSIALPESEDDMQRKETPLELVRKWGGAVLNPPLIGGAAAVFFGLIPFLHRQVYDSDGWLSPFGDSIDNLGKLYTVLQMLVLGAHLYSKRGTSANTWMLLWLFSWRFVLMPVVSITTIYFTAKTWPNLISPDPMLHFVLMISNTGPPALTLSAIAELADLSPEVEGEISRIILLSYVVTPFIAFPITAAVEAVQRLDIGILNVI